MASPAAFEILGSKLIEVTSLTFQGSRDVIGHVTIWYPIYHLLLAVLLEPILYL